jgi:hypothetical protein
MLYPRERKSDYPFTLPYIEVLNRLMEVLDMLKKIVMWNAWHNKGILSVLKLEEYLKRLADDNKEVMNSYKNIKSIWRWLKDISDLDIEGWLKDFKTEAQLTP